MEWKKRYEELMKNKIAFLGWDKEVVDDLLISSLESIEETLEELRNYKPNELVMVYDEYCNGLLVLELDEWGDTIDNMLFSLLDAHLNIGELQFEFMFLVKEGSHFASKLSFVELAA